MMMKSERTTLTLEPDVAAELGRLRRAEGKSLKALVNEVLRLGLQQLASRRPGRRGTPLRTSSVDLGECLVPLDDIAEALAIAEGEDFE
jgi:hypothetical protein